MLYESMNKNKGYEVFNCVNNQLLYSNKNDYHVDHHVHDIHCGFEKNIYKWYTLKYIDNNKIYYISRLHIDKIEKTEKIEKIEKTEKTEKTENTDNAIEISKVSFISIEYSHPDMDYRIPIELNKSWYVVGNELFSFAMVMHMLKSQSQSYIFDKTYTLYIMDNNIQSHELKYNNCITLDKKKIHIFNV
jgi:hypothetical protein